MAPPIQTMGFSCQLTIKMKNQLSSNDIIRIILLKPGYENIVNDG